MKILILHHFGGIGGGTISCLDVADMLIRCGHDVTLVAVNPCDYIYDKCRLLGIHMIDSKKPLVTLTYHRASSGWLKTCIKYLLSIRYFGYWTRLIKNVSPDLVLMNSSVQAPMNRILRKLGIKSVCFVRETFRSNGVAVLNNKLKRYIGMSDGVVFLTGFDMKSWCVDTVGPQCVVPDIMNPVEKDVLPLQIRKEYSIEDNIKIILYLGGLSAEKGAIDILKAYKNALVTNSDLCLLLLGGKYEDFLNMNFIKRILYHSTISYVKKCNELIDALKCSGAKLFDIGLVGDISPWYECADIVVFPVKKVHQARPVYEAGYYKKPVIVPAYPNFDENVVNGYNGLTYMVDDYEDLSDKILQILSCDERRIQMGINNYDMYYKKHTMDVAIKALSDFINTIS